MDCVKGLIDLTPEEKRDTAMALLYWSNWIETGEITLSATDAAEMKKPAKHLSIEQMRKIIGLRDLAKKIWT